jgi:hypothetical protein
MVGRIGIHSKRQWIEYVEKPIVAASLRALRHSRADPSSLKFVRRTGRREGGSHKTVRVASCHRSDAVFRFRRPGDQGAAERVSSAPAIRPNEVLCTAYISRPELCKSAGSC